jgi:type III restriction enzyme
MLVAPFQLKDYQTDLLDRLKSYLTEVALRGEARLLFFEVTGRPYIAPPPLGAAPYVCLRVPTGGGKTVLAAHAIPIAAQAYMRTDTPVVIWFTPSTTIRDQTLKTLRDRAHPNRRALAATFGENVRIMDTEEALRAKRPDYDGGAVVIVSTIQAFRSDSTEGRKVYEANGDLMDHFSGLAEDALALLESEDGRAPVLSLANVFRLRRPLVISDEAHNMSTQLSFATLARLSPSLVIEFTATPVKHAEHKPEDGRYASNVLHHVSAAELKLADMIKLPVILRGRADPKETIEDAMARLRQLEDLARAEEAATREFIRPIMLLQAEAKSKDRDTLDADRLKEMLVRDFDIDAGQIAVATGTSDELDGVDLFARECPIKYIVTQQKLREGWDCSFAYVLCSVAPQKSERSVEQILGRILRLPHAKRKMQEELNSAFAFATTTSFQKTASMLAEGLVANGFEREEATYLVQGVATLPGVEPGGDAYHYAVPIPDELAPEAVKERIERLTSGRVTVDLPARKLMSRGAISMQDRKHIEMAWPEAAPVVRRLAETSWGWLRAPEDARERRAFTAPGLAVRTRDRLDLFDSAHFLDHPWPLETCDAASVLDAFVDVPAALGARIDIGNDGDVKWLLEDDETPQARLFARGDEWSKAQLVRWLDRRIGERRDILPVSSRLFIGAALDLLMEKRSLDLKQLGRARFRLQWLMMQAVARLRVERSKKAWDAVLLPQSGLELVTHSDAGFAFDSADETTYGHNTTCAGRFEWRKHVFRQVGDLKPSGEEFDFAVYLDSHPEVEAWVRNTERQPNSFWLQTSTDRFYPDFIAKLKDRRILVAEYKGAHLASGRDAVEKKFLGELWAERSGGACLFVVIEGRDLAALDRAIAR